ncbi:MAG: hypothetical protein Q8P56_03770 [Candidatus Uhrbacteria bacterium]|nr:hypothetical protein [Candidatus Uhrbacteria bacterium]
MGDPNYNPDSQRAFELAQAREIHEGYTEKEQRGLDLIRAVMAMEMRVVEAMKEGQTSNQIAGLMMEDEIFIQMLLSDILQDTTPASDAFHKNSDLRWVASVLDRKQGE